MALPRPDGIYVTTQDARLRKAFVISDAHALRVTSLALAKEADSLAAAAHFTAIDAIDIDDIEAQLAKVRRHCADVCAGMEKMPELAASDVDTAENVINLAHDLFAQAETEFNRASFEVNFATAAS